MAYQTFASATSALWPAGDSSMSQIYMVYSFKSLLFAWQFQVAIIFTLLIFAKFHADKSSKNARNRETASKRTDCPDGDRGPKQRDCKQRTYCPDGGRGPRQRDRGPKQRDCEQRTDCPDADADGTHENANGAQFSLPLLTAQPDCSSTFVQDPALATASTQPSSMPAIGVFRPESIPSRPKRMNRAFTHI
ncbi:hypothetical protein B0T25DRAFT_59967 [Lasiosphaeria hispida]|uniref:Uncharacterized protein n=1 Tax=Lasiosphaeria hispida TaxID=260671 RepID=A0AAJ0HWI8_9PEZI|nr:hypothetical protein B0T25DRAFT_59967 [Lasiosphaeria hispida]